jgi:uncharacterized protein YeeX (DUF496 family)
MSSPDYTSVETQAVKRIVKRTKAVEQINEEMANCNRVIASRQKRLLVLQARKDNLQAYLNEHMDVIKNLKPKALEVP